MLGIIVLVMLLIALSRRAFDKGQNRWKWVGIGIAVWFGSQLALGILAAMILQILGHGAWMVSSSGKSVLNIAGIGVAIIAYLLLYRYISRLPEPESSDLLISQLGREPADEEHTDHSAA
jgi:heme A synthase